MQIRKNALKTLIDDYKKIRADTDIKNISEQTIRSWIDDFLKIFGWDT